MPRVRLTVLLAGAALAPVLALLISGSLVAVMRSEPARAGANAGALPPAGSPESAAAAGAGPEQSASGLLIAQATVSPPQLAPKAPQTIQVQAPPSAPVQAPTAPVAQSAAPAPRAASPYEAMARMRLEANYAGPLRDTLIQRLRDPIDGATCFVYLPISVPHEPAREDGLVRYAANPIGSISCFPGSAVQSRPAQRPAPARQPKF